MVAIAVVVRRYLTPQVIFLNLGGFPLVMAGLLLGPVGGAYVGGLSDLIGAWMAPIGKYDPFFTYTSILTAVLPVLVVRLLQKGRGVPSFWALLVAIAVGQGVTKCCLIPLIRHFETGVPTWVVASTQAWEQLLHVPFYALLARAVMRSLPPRLLNPVPPRASASMPCPGLISPAGLPPD